MTQTEPAALLLDDDTVARYLRDHPDFFQRYPKLVSELSLPHESGAAISLVERQMALLRERNIDLRKRLAGLMRAAEDNDRLFAKVRALTLTWLDAATLPALDAALATGLIQDFDADHAICYYHGAAADPATTPHLRWLAPDAVAPMSHLAQATGVSCGMLRGDEMAALFGLSQSADGSAVLVRIGGQSATSAASGPASGAGTDPAGSTERKGSANLLAVGSRDPKHFTPDMDTLFVRYIGDVLARVLARFAAVRG
jgi:uncharacterized protein